ncbi:hypothetical protein [Aeromonas enteropelogenes]|uniref:DUF5673 domain-containing protein n=1 Tax=Aeromonas enteropelogenes TaxID=29489 RepID=A0ABU9J7W7_AEREN
MSDTTEHNQNVENAEADGANHYYSEQYLELQKEPVLYEWQIDHQQYRVWLAIAVVGGGLWAISLGFLIFGNNHIDRQLSLFFFILGVLAALQGRYLFAPNQLYHYRMTAKGIYYTQQDKIPEMAYTIARGIGGLLIVVSIIAVGLVGPLALVGAGAGAFLAFKITNMKPEIHHYGCIFKGTGEISIFREIRGIKVWGLPAETGEYGLIFTRPNEYDKVLGDITNALPEYKVIEAATRKEFGY